MGEGAQFHFNAKSIVHGIHGQTLSGHQLFHLCKEEAKDKFSTSIP